MIGRGVLRASFGRDRHQIVELDAAHLDVPADLPEPGAASPDVPARVVDGSLAERLERFERETIEAAVVRHRGNWAAAARDLGLHRSNLHHRARRLGLKG